MKQPRVSILKHNVKVGDRIPNASNDATVGQWIDHTLTVNGYNVDKFGVVDIPDLNIDNKSRKKGSKTHHSIGSQTIKKWLDYANFKDTDIYKKLQNQNQVIYDSNFSVITSVRLVDMDIDVTQDTLEIIYNDLRKKLVNGDRSKSIYSNCKRGVAECYTHSNSYKFRLTDKYMKQVQNIAGNRDTFSKYIKLS
jgi:hypothetical protein